MTLPVLAALALQVQLAGTPWEAAPPLPRPVTNNAVVAVETSEGPAIFSFLGLDRAKGRESEVDWAFRWDVGTEAWRPVRAVPGPGRLAATAQSVGGKVYLFGGYTVAEDGAERSLARVDVYDPETDAWSEAAPMPVPVDDAVSGVWRDSLVYVVSGWSDDRNVSDVQLYDPLEDRWSPATPIPGPPVFGHTGTVARDAIVYVDGVRAAPRDSAAAGGNRFALESSAWRGDIDPRDPTRIEWSRLPDHPGRALYRGAAAAVGTRVVFVGGGDNPYNYDGIGYDGVAAAPVDQAFVYDLLGGTWRRGPAPGTATMDHRGAVRSGGWVFVVGGMLGGGEVTDVVQRISLLELVAGR